MLATFTIFLSENNAQRKEYNILYNLIKHIV